MCLISHDATNHMTMLAELVSKACNHQNCIPLSIRLLQQVVSYLLQLHA